MATQMKQPEVGSEPAQTEDGSKRELRVVRRLRVAVLVSSALCILIPFAGWFVFDALFSHQTRSSGIVDTWEYSVLVCIIVSLALGVAGIVLAALQVRTSDPAGRGRWALADAILALVLGLVADVLWMGLTALAILG